MRTARSFLLSLLLLQACTSAGVDGGSGDEEAGQGGSGGGAYEPCASKKCGDMCSPCDPADPSCIEADVESYCDASGACLPGVPMCGDPCSNDADCGYGVEWCVQGACVPCNNSGAACDIACGDGWAPYERNGCDACACAPVNECIMDGHCPAPSGALPACYAGAFCWDWCPPGDPTCCYGNTCGEAGCPSSSPAGCFTTGCSSGETCSATGCAPSACACNNGSWACTADCAGGVCLLP
jgi:hypothetical protein